jgi:extradiol dioxygenase family protein
VAGPYDKSEELPHVLKVHAAVLGQQRLLFERLHAEQVRWRLRLWVRQRLPVVRGSLLRPQDWPLPQLTIPFLSPEWFDMVNREAEVLPPIDGATVTLEIAIKFDAGVTAMHTLRFVDGRMTCRNGSDEDRELRFDFAGVEEYEAQLTGALSMMTAYAKGRMLMTGHREAVVHLGPLMDRPSYRELSRRIQERTAFP